RSSRPASSCWTVSMRPTARPSSARIARRPCSRTRAARSASWCWPVASRRSSCSRSTSTSSTPSRCAVAPARRRAKAWSVTPDRPDMAVQRPIAVLGAGSWGTALAALLARNGVATRLWGRDAAQMAAMAASGRNVRYLPDLDLPASLTYAHDLDAAIADARMVLVVTPSHAFGDLLARIVPSLPADAGVVWASKGFEPGTGRFLHEVAFELLGERHPQAVLTGPSFAREVVQGLPTAVTVHSPGT